MPRLHLPYDENTMSKSPFPLGLRRETLRSSYVFTGILASTILFNWAQWQIWKNRKPVALRHIAVTLYDSRTVIVGTMHNFSLSFLAQKWS